MASLPLDTWLRLIIWLVIGMVVYFGYGRHHSRAQAAANSALLPVVNDATQPTDPSGSSISNNVSRRSEV
jgi:hypothetical protein